MLNENFQFSQASLQDFTDCPRRFQLRYIEELAWPAIETEPVEEQERRILLGMDFHRIVQQHLIGIPEDFLGKVVVNADLERWWRNYKVYRPYALPGTSYPEIALTMPVAGHRLAAKIDLLVVETGSRMTILDWKTTQHIARAPQLQKRLQTRVYRYIAVQAGAYLNTGNPLKPADVEMIYWFPEYPESPARLPYSEKDFAADHRYLAQLIDEITSLDDTEFHKTEDHKRCDFCRYRTYCGTSDHVGKVASYEDEQVGDIENNTVFDFEQIAEIEF